ncbi:MAG: hypothetical protein J7621_25990 [Niastella sp.]|nr:hypothetical protein [Niastella sp.]
MKAMLLVLLPILLFVTGHAQVRIDFTGFHCYAETGETSGSDEVSILIGVFKDGKYLYSKMFPSSGYQGGVDAGGTYQKGAALLYEGAPGNLVLEVNAYEIDDIQPGDFLKDYDALQRSRFRGTDPQIAINTLTNEFNTKATGNVTTNDNKLYIKRSYLDAQGVQITGTLAGDRDIDGLPYHFKVKVATGGKQTGRNPFVGEGVGIEGVFFRVSHSRPEIKDMAIRRKWVEQNGAIGYPTGDVESLGLLRGTFVPFQNARIYQSATGIFLVQGDIYRYYEAQGGVSKFGFPLTDEQAIEDGAKGQLASWSLAGYTRVSKFQNGVILSGANKKAIYHTNEKYAAGPLLDTELKPGQSPQAAIPGNKVTTTNPTTSTVKKPTATPALNPQPLPPKPRKVSVKQQ